MKKILVSIVTMILLTALPSTPARAEGFYTVKNLEVIIKYPRAIAAPISGCKKFRVYAKLRLAAEKAYANEVRIAFQRGDEYVTATLVFGYRDGKFELNGKKTVSWNLKICKNDWYFRGDVAAGVGRAKYLDSVVLFYSPEYGTDTKYGPSMKLIR